MAPGDYASVGTGKLKLKGVKDSKVDKTKKKKKKSKSRPESEASSSAVQRGGDENKDDRDDDGDDDDAQFQDRSVMLRNLRAEDELIAKDERREKRRDGEVGDVENQEGHGERHQDEEANEAVKTEAERRYDEQRRKRVCGVSLLLSYGGMASLSPPFLFFRHPRCPGPSPLRGFLHPFSALSYLHNIALFPLGATPGSTLVSLLDEMLIY